MDDISEKLNSILSDPQSLNRIREMAEGLFSDQKPAEENLLPDIDITKIMNIVGKIKNSGLSQREKLLLALRPHLKEERRERLDTAVKILKLIEIAPYLKDSGLF